ncbi:alpha/beta hydrolase [Paenibacillus xerothermodurans]|uniref:alpha/beta hydrolase n=1 Tax=Paenibacillus xerothermodurans TaxID=1977292 RepID=UPI001FB50A98|nr:alpha/beta fold hydrolase [Paenibacillus xerothermodurans]
MDNKQCLLLHGFTGGPYEVTPLADHLAELGMTCHVPVLPGHDPELRTLGQVSWRDWLEGASQEADRLTKRHGRIDLVGFSMGGLLAAYLANRFPVRRLVLLNAAVFYFSPQRFIKDIRRRIKLRDWAFWDWKIKKTPLPATLQFVTLNRRMRPELSKIEVPTLIAQGARDPIIHPKSAIYLYQHVKGEKELHVFPNTRHMICLEPEAPIVFAAVAQFLDKP